MTELKAERDRLRDAELPEWVSKFMNRRTDVERRLFSASDGLTRDECRTLAAQLAVPREYWSVILPPDKEPSDAT